MAELIQDEPDLKLDFIKFYTDSKVALSYVYNKSKRCSAYLITSSVKQKIWAMALHVHGW